MIIHNNYKLYNIFLITQFFNFYKTKHLKQIIIIILIIIFLGYKYKFDLLKNNLRLNENYFKVLLGVNLTFNKSLTNKIKVAIYYTSIKNGGIERLVALLITYLEKINIFDTFLLTSQPKEENEYHIPRKVKRIIINSTNNKELLKIINRNKIDILIYHFYNDKEIQNLNKLKNTKTIFYNNSCFLIWLYLHYYYFYKTIYNDYKNSNFIISLVPFENDYLFKKWNINSILMNNFITYEYNYIIPSDLSSPIILMFGRCDDKMKRYEMGLKAMKHIIKEIPESEMKIISNKNYCDYLINITKLLELEKNVNFVGYSSYPEIYFKSSSLHIFPSVSESFGLVLSETKIFGIPTILVGLDYLSISKGGTIIIYDDNPETIAKESIKILKNKNYRKKLGKEARKSMLKFKNIFTVKKWITLILSIYNGKEYYDEIRLQKKHISEKESINILRKQIELLKIRDPIYENITINNIENLNYMKNLQNYF